MGCSSVLIRTQVSQAEPDVFYLDPIVSFHFDPVSLGTRGRELLTSQRLSVDAFKQFPEPCTSGNYVSRCLHVRWSFFVLLLEEIILCSSLWNFQVPSSRQALTSGFAFHLQCEGLHAFFPYLFLQGKPALSGE